ncbi:MFS general substrate transporter [Mycena belliarum]|uniref:MFS general substrate transporter n=1 Tax=Mycena belliarum TaxID=1033014 RepID=A0AAD6XSB5_9AGAR|nr:MFS general substrate transporter [Mycena belliae]
MKASPKLELSNPPASAAIIEENPSKAYALDARHAWSTLLGAFLLQFCVVGPVMAFGVFQDFYLAGFLSSYSASDISWIGSVQLFLDLGCGALSGKLYDSGHCRAAVICGSALFAFSFFMLSLTQAGHYYQVFLAQGLGMGIGIALIFVPTCTLVSQHFKAHKALAMGILSASAPMGGVIFTIMLNQMIHHGPGFRWAVRAAAFLATGCFIAANGLITMLPPPPPTTAAHPELSLVKSIANIPFSLTVFAGGVAQLGTLFPTFYLQTFAQTHNFSSALTFYAPVILNVSTILGRIIPNVFADRWGALEVYIVCVGANGLIGFVMLGSNHTAGLVLFSVFFGFFFGSTISLYLPVVAGLVPREADMGIIMGIAVVPVGIASLIGTPIAGAIIGPQLVWWKGIIFASIVLVVASALLLLAKVLQSRRR